MEAPIIYLGEEIRRGVSLLTYWYCQRGFMQGEGSETPVNCVLDQKAWDSKNEIPAYYLIPMPNLMRQGVSRYSRQT